MNVSELLGEPTLQHVQLFLFSGLTGCGFGQFTSVLLILAQNRFRFFQCLHNMVKISI